MLTAIMIGNKISEARKNKNLSQSQLAESLSISSQAVGKWERGESMPDIITFNRLAEILGVDLNYFSEKGEAEKAVADEKPTEAPSDEPIELPVRKLGRKPTWDMSNGNWVDADFSGLKNLREKFNNSNMQKCLFIDSDLSRLTLKGNNINACNFSGSDLSECNLIGSNLMNNLFKNCSLMHSEFSGSHIQGCDFSGADFTDSVIKSCSFTKNTIKGTVWNRTEFRGTELTHLIFENDILDCSFEDCWFMNDTFQNMIFTNTFFKNGNLKRIRFTNCKADSLSYAFLKNGKADMTGITVIG